MPSTRRLRRFHPPGARGAASSDDLLYPLDVLCAQAGISPPVVRRIARTRIPPPYDELLVHHDDMTLKLERHCGGPIAVRVLCAALKGRSYFRRVLLVEASSARPLAMGAVRIRLDVVGRRNREKILRQEEPLGRILREGGVDFVSSPVAFFDAKPNAEMMAVFRMPKAQTLYGRRTQVTLRGVKIGDIVEVLPLL
jgi:chorismate-pyruvate lyase